MSTAALSPWVMAFATLAHVSSFPSSTLPSLASVVLPASRKVAIFDYKTGEEVDNNKRAHGDEVTDLQMSSRPDPLHRKFRELPFTPPPTKSPRRSSHSTEPVTSWKIPQSLTLGPGPGRPLLPSPRGCGVRYEGRIGDYAGEEEGSPGGVSGRRLLCNSGSLGLQLECTRGLWVFDGVKPRDQKAAYRTIDGSPSTDRWLASLSTTKSSGSL